jgi:formylglycine-generating enzyme required for sulfatase activity/serine/threonine protein kinase
MSDSSDLPKSCPQCGAELPLEATDGLCPKCLMGEAMQPTIVSDASKPKNSAILAPEELAPFFPQYEILRMLGRGGMGAVYLARQISLNRLVAIKILPADMGDSDQGFAERFKNEAQAMAQLSHPGIVAVFDFGQTANGLLFIVMEYIEGTDVQLMLTSQGRLHSAHAMAITAHVCDALQYAHTRGIIHRDIKPSNIMVSNDGVVKVADFGLAKMSQGQTTGLTQSGMAMGTPHFMAPEALTLGSAVDQRADIYAVGVMLYQMLTGKLPQGMFEMPSFQVPGLDPRYDRIVAKALREDREVRYQAAVELRHDLDAILTQPVEKTAPDAETEVKALPPVEQRGKKKARVPRLPPQNSPQVPARKKPVGLILVVLGVVAAIAAAFVYFRDHGTGSTTQPEQATKATPFVNSLGMKFVPVPITGGPTDKQRVLFSVWETRVQDYEVFVKETKHAWSRPDVEQGPTHAVAGVSWADAQTFCVWLTERERKTGKLGANERYSLPSDHEWSCALEIGHKENAAKQPNEKSGRLADVFPWGDQWPPPANSGNYWSEELRPLLAAQKYRSIKGELPGYQDGQALVGPVGRYAANGLGIHDLGGNLWEWCEDWLDAAQNERVLRGGSWTAFERNSLVSSYRNHQTPGTCNNSIGFRVVLAPTSVVFSFPSLPDSKSSSASATKDAPFTNTLGMKFVPVPGTKVLMCIHETRRQDYAAYAGQTPAVDGLWKNSIEEGIPVSDKDDHPVVSVNWDDVQAFCGWLSKKEGKVYRLPTDQEWSFAVGIGDDEIRNADTTPEMLNGKVAVFPWGTGLPPPKGAGNYADITLNQTTGNHRFIPDYTDGFATTAPVMSFTPNKLGLYDLGGNVWEWVEDWWNVDQKQRVCRGASFGPHGAQVYSSARYASWPHLRRSMFGFRLVTEVPGTDSTSAFPGKNQPLNASVSQTSATTKDAPFTNTLGMKFVPVPITGGPTDGQRVLFSIWETRVQDYEVFVKETKGKLPNPGFEQSATHPVIGLNRDGATAFCVWLTERERQAGKIATGESYRLPSDHEWSCAVGIGEREDVSISPWDKGGKILDVYPWGSEWPPPKGAGNYAGEELRTTWESGNPAYVLLRGIVDTYRDGFEHSAPVGSFSANSWGLFDLGGNAAEWVADWVKPTEQLHGVMRGGAWCLAGSSLLSSHRNQHPPNLAFRNLSGFRVVLAPVAAGEGRAAAPSAAASGPAGISTPSTALGGPSALPSAATKDSPFTNTLGMKFVPVPGTNILMGIHETRRQDYRVYADAVSGTDATWKAPVVDGKPLVQGEDHPVIHVSWEDATAFCQWLGKKEGHTYRLPTDHEWSLAVAIGVENPRAISPAELQEWITDSYPWPTPALPRSTTKLGGEERQRLRDKHKQQHQEAWEEGFRHGNYLGTADGYRGTSPVMSFLPNHLGIHDLGGNAWEWCLVKTTVHDDPQPLRGAGFRNFSWPTISNSRELGDRRLRMAPKRNGALEASGFRCVVELQKHP